MNRIALILTLSLLMQASCAEDKDERYANCKEVQKEGEACVEWMTREERERDQFSGLTLEEKKASHAARRLTNAKEWAGLLSAWEEEFGDTPKCKRQAHENYPGPGRREFAICKAFVIDFDRPPN